MVFKEAITLNLLGEYLPPTLANPVSIIPSSALPVIDCSSSPPIKASTFTSSLAFANVTTLSFNLFVEIDLPLQVHFCMTQLNYNQTF